MMLVYLLPNVYNSGLAIRAMVSPSVVITILKKSLRLMSIESVYHLFTTVGIKELLWETEVYISVYINFQNFWYNNMTHFLGNNIHYVYCITIRKFE